ncbi:hypothetical protein JCM10207_003196 [Rhodosporidiobolus poonsookiae]
MSALPLSVEHLPLLGYFALIGALLLAILPNFTARKPNLAAGVFLLFALASVGSTWTYMLRYFQRSFLDSAARAGVPAAEYTSQAWLRDVSLFHEAWGYVCANPYRWWWSEQLCLWTVGPLTILLAVEGRRRGIKRTWAFMLLGQVVAVSFAQSLFFAALALAPPAAPAAPAVRTPAAPRANSAAKSSPLTWLVILAVVLGNASVAFTPGTVFSRYFLANLLAMHCVLFLPFLLPDTKQAPFALSRFYLNIALVGLRFRAPTALELLPADLPRTAKAIVPELPALFAKQWAVLNEHPAQQSIGWDVIFASLSAVAYLVWSSRAPTRPAERVAYPILALVVLATPFVGASTAVGVGLAMREGKKEARADAEHAVESARRAEAVRELAAVGNKKKE